MFWMHAITYALFKMITSGMHIGQGTEVKKKRRVNKYLGYVKELALSMAVTRLF